MNQNERYKKITKIIGKFKNGEELYKRNAVFNKVVHMLVEGMDVYDVFEQVILTAEQTQKMFEDYINRDTRPFEFKK
jgi:hypothetical protein